MNKAQKVVVILLVIAIVFSVLTMVLTLSFGNFTSIKSPQPKANVQLVGHDVCGTFPGELSVGVEPPVVEE